MFGRVEYFVLVSLLDNLVKENFGRLFFWGMFLVFVLCLQCFGQFWQCGEEICDQIIIGDLEDWGFFIFVDGYDDFGVFYVCQVLDGIGNINGDIEFWSDNFVGLVNLVIVGNEVCIDSSVGSIDCCVEFVGNGVEQVEVFIGLYVVIIGDDDFCRGQFWMIGFGQFF